METRKLFVSCAIAASLLATAAYAQTPGASPQNMPNASTGHLAVGVVKAIDPTNRALTISHKAIASMGMPGSALVSQAPMEGMQGMQGMPHSPGKSMMEQCQEMMMKRK